MNRFPVTPYRYPALQPRLPVLILVVIALAALLIAGPAAATAPSDIVISYDPGTEKLSVTITHITDNPATHYVSKIQVKQNDRVISDPDYKSQPTKDTFTHTYDVKALSGDTFRVIATCSISGSLEKVYEFTPRTTAATPATPAPADPAVPAAPAVTPNTPAPTATTQKSPLGIVPFRGVAAFLLMRKE